MDRALPTSSLERLTNSGQDQLGVHKTPHESGRLRFNIDVYSTAARSPRSSASVGRMLDSLGNTSTDHLFRLRHQSGTRSRRVGEFSSSPPFEHTHDVTSSSDMTRPLAVFQDSCHLFHPLMRKNTYLNICSTERVVLPTHLSHAAVYDIAAVVCFRTSLFTSVIEFPVDAIQTWQTLRGRSVNRWFGIRQLQRDQSKRQARRKACSHVEGITRLNYSSDSSQVQPQFQNPQQDPKHLKSQTFNVERLRPRCTVMGEYDAHVRIRTVGHAYGNVGTTSSHCLLLPMRLWMAIGSGARTLRVTNLLTSLPMVIMDACFSLSLSLKQIFLPVANRMLLTRLGNVEISRRIYNTWLATMPC